MKQEFIEDNLIVFSKQTSDIFLKQKNPSDVMGLYWFYYYTAKWQKTNQPKCTLSYIMKGLNWSLDKARLTKKILMKLGLIENIRETNTQGKVTGWYIKLNYIWKKSVVSKTRGVASPEGGFYHRVAKPPTNALSANRLNALSANKKRKKKKISFSALSYEKIEDTYKTKAKIYNQKGLVYIPRKKTPLQKKSLDALLLLNYFKDRAKQSGAGEFFKHPSDKKEIENKNGKLRKQAIRFYERCDLSVKKAKKVIRWFLKNGDWCNYSPETCFSLKMVRDFEIDDKKRKIKTWEKLE